MTISLYANDELLTTATLDENQPEHYVNIGMSLEEFEARYGQAEISVVL